MNKKQYEPAGRSFTEVIRSILNETPSSSEGETKNIEHVNNITESQQAGAAEK